MSSICPVHHLDLNVSDPERSAEFYDRVLGSLGYRRENLPPDPGFDWIAPAEFGRFSIGLVRARKTGPYDRYGPGIQHLALRAESREEVDELYHMLMSMKVTILDAPREYPEYEPGYYAVFFLDPDGIKLELVFTEDRK